jgi:pimeloyl-ACP methyl ester carboxylesterase
MLETQTAQQSVLSRDGTRIAYQKTGSGTPLLLVHGTGGDRMRWNSVLPRLSQHFTVYAMDRRGRGGSGDGAGYAITREYEDIAALAAAIDGPVDVLGHSFGAACVLGAAPMIPNLHKLILYEPPMLHEQQTPRRMEILECMDQALAAGEMETIVVLMMRDMLQTPMPIVERARTTPAWAGSVSAAHTMPRELHHSDDYGANLELFKSISAPTLFLLGSSSPENFKITTETLLGLIPNSQAVILPGQQHSAMLTAPDLFSDEIIRFLKA